MMAIHDIARAGFGKGTNELYDKARPSYPPRALSAIYSAIRSKTPFNIVEIGSGTGIFTRALLAHESFSKSIEHLIAVEPSDGMRAIFTRQIKDLRVEAKAGTFENTELDGGAADFVVVAQAWHWCSNYDAGMKEIARILKPDGVAFFIWNLEDQDAAEWVRSVREKYEIFEQSTPQFRLGLWRETFETESYKMYFEPQEELSWDRIVPTTKQGVIDRVLSKSYITQLSEEDKEELCVKIRKYLDEETSKVWIDEANGIFEYPYITSVIVMRRKVN